MSSPLLSAPDDFPDFDHDFDTSSALTGKIYYGISVLGGSEPYYVRVLLAIGLQ